MPTFQMLHPGDEDSPHFDQLITVEFNYYPGCRGQRDSYGAPIEPDDPPELEIISVQDEKGEEITLTEEEEYDADLHFWEKVMKE